MNSMPGMFCVLAQLKPPASVLSYRLLLLVYHGDAPILRNPRLSVRI
jgi:hypothetical protein